MRVPLILLGAAALLGAASARAEDSTVDLAAIGPHDAVRAPRVKLQIAGGRIGWRLDDLRDAFRDAAQDGLPVVLATEGDDGGLFANVLRCPTFNTLAGRAHFVLIPLPVADEASDAARLIYALRLDPVHASAVVVLDTSAGRVNEIARVSGYVGEAELLRRFAAAGLTPGAAPLPLETVTLGDKPPKDCAR
jgi:hypothetical protein